MKICPNCKCEFEKETIFCCKQCSFDYQKLNPYGMAKLKGKFSRGIYRGKNIECHFDDKGCLISDNHGLSFDGYPQIFRDKKIWVLSRWIFYINFGHLPPVVMHTCDNPLCINPIHLVAGTIKSNSEDMVKKGRAPIGLNQNNGGIKLNEDKVREIKIKLIKGQSLLSLAKEYNVSKKNILYIKQGKKWKNVIVTC